MALRAVTSNGVAITPSSVSLPTGGTFDLYNTADQTTNYERLRVGYQSNTAEIGSFLGGTGIARSIRFGTNFISGSTAVSRYVEVSTAGSINISASQNTSGLNSVNLPSNAALGASSSTQCALNIQTSVNQSGTAGATILNVDPTVSATGSGTYLAQRWGWNGTTVGNVTSVGYFNGVRFIASQVLGLSGSLGGSDDVQLTRDAADTLALRRSTDAQTFRVYNTYTDASNYRRWNLSWNTTTAIMQVVGAGTGTNGNLAVGNAALATNATVGYFMIPSSDGAPTGVPADIPTGQVALHFDSTNNKLYVYDGGWLSTAALT